MKYDHSFKYIMFLTILTFQTIRNQFRKKNIGTLLNLQALTRYVTDVIKRNDITWP